MKIYFI